MDNFDSVINLLVLLTVFSIVAERASNVLKFRREKLRDRTNNRDKERAREGAIQTQTLLVGITIAIIAKADLFSIMAHLDDPWSTLGWVRVIGPQWFRSPATQDLGALLYTFGGCILTGLALGFGSKFWHDILSTVFELRTFARRKGSDVVTREGVPIQDAFPEGNNATQSMESPDVLLNEDSAEENEEEKGVLGGGARDDGDLSSGGVNNE